MKKYLPIILIIFVTAAISCNKNNSTENSVFVPVRISPDFSACPCCGTGFFVYRQDSMITYKCDTIPANTVITSWPAMVKIRFHANGPGCPFAKNVIDEIKE
jgi:hypothetical protein